MTDSNVEALLAEVERLDAAATPGEWWTDRDGDSTGETYWALAGPAGWIANIQAEDKPKGTAEFIARARTLLPELARLVALQRRALEAVPHGELLPDHTQACDLWFAQRLGRPPTGFRCTCHVALVRAALEGREPGEEKTR